MGLFSRRPKNEGAPANAKDAQSETVAHLTEFVKSHVGCEAFIEPPTRVTQTRPRPDFVAKSRRNKLSTSYYEYSINARTGPSSATTKVWGGGARAPQHGC